MCSSRSYTLMSERDPSLLQIRALETKSKFTETGSRSEHRLDLEFAVKSALS